MTRPSAQWRLAELLHERNSTEEIMVILTILLNEVYAAGYKAGWHGTEGSPRPAADVHPNDTNP